MSEPTDPHFARCALITIDIQADTLDGGPLEIPGTSAVLPNIVQLCQTFRHVGRPIVHMVRLYQGDGSNAELCRRNLVQGDTPLLRPATPGRLLAPGVLGPRDVELDDDFLLDGGTQRLDGNEVVIYKPRWGAFFRTPLESHLEGLGVDTLAFAGCNFPNCPRTSAYEASERDYRIVVVEDAVSGLYDRGRDELLDIGVRVMSTEHLLMALNAGGTGEVTERSSRSKT
jgi:nicotinamidase-related amidase